MSRFARATLLFSLIAALALLLASPTAAWAQAFGESKKNRNSPPPGEEVALSIAASKAFAVPGDTVAIAVVFDHVEGWHVHPHTPVVPPELTDFEPIPTEISIEAAPPDAAKFGPIQWPATHKVKVAFSGKPVLYEVYEGQAIAYIPILIPAAATGELHIKATVKFQACNDQVCSFPQSKDLSLTLPIIAPSAAAGRNATTGVDAALFTAFDSGVFSKLSSWSGAPGAPGSTAPGASSAKPVHFDAFGLSFDINPSGLAGLALLFLTAALGGFLLNCTPCVLPVIPLKILGLSQSAGDPKRCFALGVVMSLGVVAFWLAIGGAIAFISGFNSISSLFQLPWFSLVVGAVIAAMAAGMLGAFTISLPKAVYFINPSHETAPGSFLFGIMTGVLATPCIAPFMGAAAAWAATQKPPITLATFASIGIGMALPYFILSANPKWVSKVPRTGPASELVKQVMGILMLAVATFFIGPAIAAFRADPLSHPSRIYWWIIAAFLVLAGAWLTIRTFQITTSVTKRSIFALISLALATAGVATAKQLTATGPIPWIAYTPERFAEATKRGDVVVVDFTAEWCLNCKALEEGVLNRPEVAALLNSKGVTPMKIDLTGDNTDGKAKLAELGRVGIPLLAIFGPGQNPPFTADFYTREIVTDAVNKARGAHSGV